jgi:signal transduction histidine kinase/uncharacterized membrane protein (UPF0136 family)
MRSFWTNPRLWFSLVAIQLLVASLVTLAGWIQQDGSLVQIHPIFPALHYHAAAAIGLLGLAYVALACDWRRTAAVLGWGLLVIGPLLGIIPRLFIDLHFEDWWHSSESRFLLAPPAQVGMGSSLCVCLLGGAIGLLSCPAAIGRNASVVGCMVLLASAVSLASYAFEMMPAVSIGSPLRMAPLEVACYAAAALATVVQGIRLTLAEPGPRPFMPILLTVLGSLATVFLWLMLDVQELHRIRRMVQFEAASIQMHLQRQAPTSFDELTQLAKRWKRDGKPSQQELEEKLGNFLGGQAGCLGVGRVYAGGAIEWLETRQDVETLNREVFGANGEEVSFSVPKGNYDLTVLRAPRTWKRSHVMLVYAPFSPGRDSPGGLLAVYRAADFFANVCHKNLASGYGIAIREGNDQVFARYAIDRVHQSTLESTQKVRFFDFTWDLQVWPGSEVIDREVSALPKLALVAGFLLSLSLAWTLYMAQTARQKALDLEREIKERHTVGKALRESEAKARFLLENLDQSVFLKDPALTYLAANQHFCEQFKTTEADLSGKTDAALFSSEIAEGYLAKEKEVLSSGQPLAWEEDRTIDGKAQVFSHRRIPVLDETGKVTGLLGMSWDMTEQRHIETHLRQAQKMDAIGLLAGGIAHDFNNLLTVVLGNLALLRAQLPSGHPGRELAANSEKAGQQAAELTQQLLGFSRQTSLRRQAINLNGVAEEVLALLTRTIDPRIKIEFKPDRGLGWMQADRGQMTQIVLNLCLNARDAMPDGGALQVEASNVDLTDKMVRGRPEAHAGQFVRLRVHDTGHGMTPEVKARIFEPFFTTKKMGKGNGLGLAIVFNIVQNHDG